MRKILRDIYLMMITELHVFLIDLMTMRGYKENDF